METLQHISHLLQARKNIHTPTTLFLPSTISLHPERFADIHPVQNWQELHDWLSSLPLSDRKTMLHYYFQRQPQMNQAGYRALAHLIGAGFFSAVLTANLDSTLEDALGEQGLFRTKDYQLLIRDGHNDVIIAHTLHAPAAKTRIIKLRGSISDDIVVTNFPDCLQFHPALNSALAPYLNGDIMIVGSPEREEDVLSLLGGHKSSIHYVLSEQPRSQDEVVKKIRARGVPDPYTQVVCGPNGDFASFFQALEALLLAPQPAPRSAEPSAQDIGKVDVLLVTTTQVEVEAVLNLFPHTYIFKGDKTYFDLGIIGNARTLMVRSEMGSISPGSSLLTIYKSIEVLQPTAVIMLGIAFGFDNEANAIGDILVATQLLLYDTHRVNAPDADQPITLRGSRPQASIRLVDRFKTGALSWHESKVRFGLVLSGEKLIDNHHYRDQLHTLAPDAIGGEMEGAGLYVASHEWKVDWLLVKAICDWASNKSEHKDVYQAKAANSASRFVLHVLKQGGLASS